MTGDRRCQIGPAAVEGDDLEPDLLVLMTAFRGMDCAVPARGGSAAIRPAAKPPEEPSTALDRPAGHATGRGAGNAPWTP